MAGNTSIRALPKRWVLDRSRFEPTSLANGSLPDGGRAMVGEAQDSVRQRFDRSVIGQKLTSIHADVLGLG